MHGTACSCRPDEALAIRRGREQLHSGGSASNSQGGCGATVAATNDRSRQERSATVVTPPPWEFDALRAGGAQRQGHDEHVQGGREAQLCNSTLPRAAGECEGGRVAQLRVRGTDACRGPQLAMHQLRGWSVRFLGVDIKA